MLLCSGINDNYLWPWLVMVRSAQLNNSGGALSIAVGNVNSGLSDDSIKIMEIFCKALDINLRIINFDLQIDLKTTYQPLTVYSKLLFLDTLEEKFIWIDADCLLLHGWDKVFQYFEILDSYPKSVLVASLDPQIESQSKTTIPNQAFLAAGDGYFNSGVFLADPIKWRLQGHNQVWKNVGMSHIEMGFKYHDQDILNYLLAGKSIPLLGKFNVMSRQPFHFEDKILHFTGKPKPWNLVGNSRAYTMVKSILSANYDSDSTSDIRDRELKNVFYWSAEESLRCILEKIDPELATRVLKLKSTQFKGLLKREKIKFWLLRFVARPWFVSRS